MKLVYSITATAGGKIAFFKQAFTDKAKAYETAKEEAEKMIATVGVEFTEVTDHEGDILLLAFGEILCRWSIIEFELED